MLGKSYSGESKSVVVVEGETPIGIITKKDILKGLSNYRMRQRDLDAIIVFEIMRSL